MKVDLTYQMRIFITFLVLGLLGLNGCVGTKDNGKHDILIHWQQVGNDVNEKGESFAQLTIKNIGKNTFTKGDWALYFNNKPCTNLDVNAIGDQVSIKRINGDFFEVKPTEKFKALEKGESLVLDLYTNSAVIKYTDAAGGFYFLFKNKGKEEFYTPAYEVGKFTPDMAVMSKDDTYEVENEFIRYKNNAKLTKVELTTAQKIIPTPIQVIEGKGGFDIALIKEIVSNSATNKQAELLQKYIKESTDKDIAIVDKATSDHYIKLVNKRVNAPSKEAYQLDIKEKEITIQGTEKGLVYGIQSLRALLPLKGESSTIKSVSIKDYPRFGYRGFMMDVARNFQTKETILNLLDVMGFYKMNTLHFHLTDDEGWRIELEKFPELIELGSKRTHPTSPYSTIPSYGSGAKGIDGVSNGYYSKEDYIEILKYAEARNIEIIPEVDIPGHARIAINAMSYRAEKLLKEGKSPEEANKYLLNDPNDASEYSSVQGFDDNTICPCQESSYNFIEALVTEFQSIYNEAGVPLETIHFGGDEVAKGVWEKSPICQEFMKENNLKDVEAIKGYYALRIAKMAKKNKVKLQLWDDILHHAKGMSPENLTLNAWDNSWGVGTEDFGYKRANQGYDVILTSVSSLYFDMAYTKEVDEPGFYWGDYNDTRAVFNYLPTHFFDIDHKLRLGGVLTVEEMKDKERLTKKGLSHIKGIQGAMWAETLKSSDRLEYMIYPKMLALAERGWAKSLVNKGEQGDAIIKKLDKQWNVFANALGQREFNRLATWGRNYRIPPVGLQVEDNKVSANIAYPGLTIRYAKVGEELTNQSPEFTSDIALDGNYQFAAFDALGNHGRVISVSEKDNLTTMK
ncbi:family 20 glycosylhydrolase [Flammeovirga sp. MY04]|uniref:family 20 glycosylhydrolase n=1 Tax=Flammeovirga sp. MY04 TaxID=1191459 RepID=UPI0008062B7B|nr:family 20 glycosylhydrolase [Flammeovirga sp. MY04]ANQ47832.1 family 20 glycosylhydrolase [Flammeovirga sp. MY04]